MNTKTNDELEQEANGLLSQRTQLQWLLRYSRERLDKTEAELAEVIREIETRGCRIKIDTPAGANRRAV